MSEASLDTRRYLENIGARVKSYHNGINRAKDFVLDNNIYDQSLVMNCIIMSILWVAAVRGEKLSESELFMFLDLEEELSESKIIEMDPKMGEWGLEEVLLYVMENY